MNRIIESCKGARIDYTKLPSDNDVYALVAHAIQRRGFPESEVRIIVSGGASSDARHVAGVPELTILVRELPKEPIVPLKVRMCFGGRRSPEYKIVGEYARVMNNLWCAEDAGFHDILYIDDSFEQHGMIKETSFGNIFFVTNANELWTPAHGVLPGVTRSRVLKIAKESGLFQAVEEIPKISENHMAGFVDAFRTSSISGAVPVELINSREFRVGCDTKTARIQELYQNDVEEYFKDHRA